MDNDELLLSSLLGHDYELDSKIGKFSEMSLSKVVDILAASELYGVLYH